MCWGLPMALQLLQEASLGIASRLDPWIAALPSQVTLPWLPGGERALAAISSPAALAECERLRGMYETACQVGAAALCMCLAKRLKGCCFPIKVHMRLWLAQCVFKSSRHAGHMDSSLTS